MDVQSRDAHGFFVSPQHSQRYREYANTYKEEEEERSNRWNDFLNELADISEVTSNDYLIDDEGHGTTLNVAGAKDSDQSGASGFVNLREIVTDTRGDVETHKNQRWSTIRSSLVFIEQMMSYRVKNWRQPTSDGEAPGRSGSCHTINEEESRGVCRSVREEEESQGEFYDGAGLKQAQEASTSSCLSGDQIPHFPCKEELERLVHGGVPMALRGELWQAFVGTKARRIEGYYDELLALEADYSIGKDYESFNSNGTNNMPKGLQRPQRHIPEKWKEQIEKDLLRTFPGHPTLDAHKRNSLRQLLIAYARHNPSVGYFQAMNFFAGLLLLLMPEENAFWTLVGILDDYFDGYYSEGMIDSQVDQLVFEDLARERFPTLVNHLEYLGIQVAWITGPWFLSIFVNVLPWESVLRVWDVLLFDGNCVMLFRTALTLMELYGASLQTIKDAGEAVTMLQTLVGSTFDSRHLTLTACMGYQTVNEIKLEHSRRKHRPDVVDVMERRSKGLNAWKEDSQGIASKLLIYEHYLELLHTEENSGAGSDQSHQDLCQPKSGSSEAYFSLIISDKLSSVPDLKRQVAWLKVELCRLLEEKRSTVLRTEELDMALMDMIKQDNRRLLSVKVEHLEEEISKLQQALSKKQEEENSMRQVLMSMEQEQKMKEHSRTLAEQDAAAHKYAVHMLEEKYEEVMAAVAQMERRAVMAEKMLQGRTQLRRSPSSPPRLLSRFRGPFGWLERHKGKLEVPTEGKIS